MKKLLLSLLALTAMGFTQVSAQNIFYGTGVIVGQAHSTPKTFRGFPGNITQGSESFLMVGFSIPVDAQVIPLANEMSVGFHIEPTLAYTIPGLSSIESDVLLLQSPLIAQFNYGNFSSANSLAGLGFGLGLGFMAQYQSTSRANSDILAEGNPLMFLPTAQASFRFWGPNNKLFAVKLSHTFGSETFNGVTSNRGCTFLSVSRYINY